MVKFKGVLVALLMEALSRIPGYFHEMAGEAIEGMMTYLDVNIRPS